MEKWALAVRLESKECDAAIKECQDQGIYLLLILSPKTKWTLDDIRTIRSLTGAPVLVLADKYDGAKKIASLEAGVDEYIQWPDTVGEGIASAKALLRRYTDLNRGDGEPSQAFFRNGILVSPERRSVSIHAQEIQFQKKSLTCSVCLCPIQGASLPIFGH